MRLVWNDNNWETPIKKKHNPSLWKNGTNNASFEKSFGFGHEDWLLNTRYEINGYQYGYIRGVQKLLENIEYIDKIYLYTIEPNNKNRLLVATIKNVEVIESNNEAQSIILPVIDKYNKQQLEELKTVGAYYKALYDYKFKVNIRFKPTDFYFLGYQNEIEKLKNQAFSRFTPYRVDDNLEKILLENNLFRTGFAFKKGKAKPVKAHARLINSGSSFNPRTHTNISEDLYDYLHKILKIDKDFISIEKSRVYNKIR